MKTARKPTAAENEEIRDLFLRARLLRPYYARAIAALRPMVVEGLGTVGVGDDWRIYLDLEWLRAMEPIESASIIAAHEVEHLLRRHHSRLGGNIAKDLEINDDIGDGERFPPGGFYPKDFGFPEGLTAEEYEAMLPESMKDKPGTCGGGSGVTGNREEYEAPKDGSGPESDLLARAVALDVKEHVRKNGQGSVPVGVGIWADAVIEPIPRDWRRELVTAIRGSVRMIPGRDDYSYSRLSRRYRHGGPLKPATVRHQPKTVLCVDTSGSMSPQTVSVVHSIMRRLTPDFLIQGDAEVTGACKRMPEQWRGGGGTDMRALMEAADEWGAELVVIVTDGYTPWPDSMKAETVAVIVDGGEMPPAWIKGVRV